MVFSAKSPAHPVSIPKLYVLVFSCYSFQISFMHMEDTTKWCYHPPPHSCSFPWSSLHVSILRGQFHSSLKLHSRPFIIDGLFSLNLLLVNKHSDDLQPFAICNSILLPLVSISQLVRTQWGERLRGIPKSQHYPPLPSIRAKKRTLLSTAPLHQ